MSKPADPLAIAFCPGCVSRIARRFRVCAQCGYEFSQATPPLTIREMLDGRESLYGTGAPQYHHVNLPALVRMIVIYVRAADQETPPDA